MERLVEFATNHYLLVLALVVILALLIGNELTRLSRRYREVEPTGATALMNHDNAMLIDVREPNEYDQGHIPGARHIPLGELQQRAGELQKYKDRPIVAYCRTGQRSARACQILTKQGFEAVNNLKGGINAWQQQHLPVTTQRKG